MPFDLRQPIELLPIFRERVWGKENLQPYFDIDASGFAGSRIGEVWFTFEENETSLGLRLGELITLHPEILGSAADPRHPGICPLLLKLLFTTERLSVQVHPDDEYAETHHGGLGKTEAWYVVDSRPPGEVAVGFRKTITAEKLPRVAKSGEIEELLEWRKVAAGDVVFIPAGTVHAIGAGLTICEVQENSDITYRLYDYGRPRELHLEHGTKVSHLGPHAFEAEQLALGQGRNQLAACEYFRIERLQPKKRVHIQAGLKYYLLLICLDGNGTIAGSSFRRGQFWIVPAGNVEFDIGADADSQWIAAYSAEQPSDEITVE